jgi:hypothetical protein
VWEKRRHSRFRVQYCAKFSLVDMDNHLVLHETMHDGKIVDMSMSGMQFACKERLRVGARYIAHIDFGDKMLSLYVVVRYQSLRRWSEGFYYFHGIQFVGATEENAILYAKFFSIIRKTQPLLQNLFISKKVS